MRNIILAALYVFLLGTISCENLTANKSGNIILHEKMNYNWNTPIEEIKTDFNDKQYTKIEIEGDLISAKGNFYGPTSDIYFAFFNGEMYTRGISLLGFPGEQVKIKKWKI